MCLHHNTTESRNDMTMYIVRFSLNAKGIRYARKSTPPGGRAVAAMHQSAKTANEMAAHLATIPNSAVTIEKITE